MIAVMLVATAIAFGESATTAFGTTCGALRCSTFTVGLGGNGTGVFAVVTSTGALTGTIECHRAGGTTYGVCAFSYPTDAVIYYRVVASPGSKTVCKPVGCDTSTTIKHFTLSANMTLASFGFDLLDPVTITVSITGSGQGSVTSKPVGISCGAGTTTCAVAFAAGSTVMLTAAESGGSTFKGWGGDCTGTQAGCSVNASSGTPVAVGARFDLVVTSTPKPTPAPTPKPTPTRAPTPQPSIQATSQPGKTTAPGRSSSPGAPAASGTIPPSAGPVAVSSGAPTPQETSVAEPVGTAGPALAPLDTPSADGGQPASSSGSGSSLLVLGLIVLLIVFAGGAFVFRKPRVKT